MQSVLDEATRLTEVTREAHRRGPFERAVREFAQLLATVPDYPVKDISTGAITELKSLADEVIVNIENRLSAHVDPGAHQQLLASSIYEIRRLLEEIDRWRRHYLGAP